MALEASIGAARVALNREFLWRVRHFIKKAALAIMAEAADTANHAERVALANSVLSGGFNIQELAFAVVTNATISGNALTDIENQGVTDSDLEFTINSMIDAHAGVSLT